MPTLPSAAQVDGRTTGQSVDTDQDGVSAATRGPSGSAALDVPGCANGFDGSDARAYRAAAGRWRLPRRRGGHRLQRRAAPDRRKISYSIVSSSELTSSTSASIRRRSRMTAMLSDATKAVNCRIPLV